MTSTPTLRHPRRARAVAACLLVQLAATSGAGLAGVTFARPALAQEDKAALARARQQFQQGISLESAGNWAGALSLFQQVAAVKLTPQVRYNIAFCEEHLGKLGLALGDYQLASAEAADAKADDVVQLVAGQIGPLKERVPKLTITRGANAQFATVSLDGVALGASSIGKEMPVDPGPHTVEAKAAGRKPFTSSLELAEKESKTVEVVLENTAEAKPDDTTLPPPPPDQAQPEGGKSPLPFIIGGVGIASLITSGVFYAMRGKAESDLESQCPTPDTCPPSLSSTYDNGKLYSTLTGVTLAIGVVGVGTGVVLLLTQKKGSSSAAPAASPESSSSSSRPLASASSGLTLGASIGPTGVSLLGRF